MDLILTGRPVDAAEALAMGLANRVVADGQALGAAIELGTQLAAFPQTCMRNDRLSAIEQWDQAIANETRHGRQTITQGETTAGAARFAAGVGRGGAFA